MDEITMLLPVVWDIIDQTHSAASLVKNNEKIEVTFTGITGFKRFVKRFWSKDSNDLLIKLIDYFKLSK